MGEQIWTILEFSCKKSQKAQNHTSAPHLVRIVYSILVIKQYIQEKSSKVSAQYFLQNQLDVVK